jgi:hypothetical protein
MEHLVNTLVDKRIEMKGKQAQKQFMKDAVKMRKKIFGRGYCHQGLSLPARQWWQAKRHSTESIFWLNPTSQARKKNKV